MKIAIIDYGAGNIRSVYKSFLKVSENNEVIVTDNAKVVSSADYVVLPGVGAFYDCIKGVYALDGMGEAINKIVKDKTKPFLGICVGMQLLAEKGFEYGEHTGFGYINGNIKKIDIAGAKVPHMGWNELYIKSPHKILSGIEDAKDNVYFVHSYHLTGYDEREVLATTNYHNHDIVAVVGKDNIVGLQFHPEKSQTVGLKIIANFINWKP